jgi:hypothetical protein
MAKDNIIFEFADTVKVLTGKTEEERKKDFMLKAYYFIMNKCWYDRVYNLNSFWAEGDLNRKRFITCVKDLIQTGAFGKTEVEFNNDFTKFRKRDDFKYRTVVYTNERKHNLKTKIEYVTQ